MNSKDQNDLSQLQTGILKQPSARQSVQWAMDYLQKSRRDYHWVGIYLLKGDKLHLGPYVGPQTDHDVIPIGRGVCGTAVAENKNQIVDDVRHLSNYLACNLDTRSEIVVLIRDDRTGAILGQIDVDGTKVQSFGKEEEEFLTQVAVQLAPYMIPEIL